MANNSGRTGSAEEMQRTIRQLKIKMVLSLSALSLVLIALIAAFFVVNRGMKALEALDTIDYQKPGEVVSLSDEDIRAIKDEERDETLSNSDAEVIEDAEAKIMSFLETGTQPLAGEDEILNIMLVGCDAKSYDKWIRSDSMIIFSIDRAHKKIKLTSLMRDMYVSIPGYGLNKLNAAFAFGGGELLLKTVAQNYKVDMSKYVCVNYSAFVEVVDRLGGLYITVEDKEVDYLNKYVKGGAQNKLSEGGTQLLNGQQVLAYCRIRKLGTDSARTQRQRTALKGLVTKLKSASATELTDIATATLPSVKTNLEESEVKSLILDALGMRDYTIDELKVPVDGTWQDMTVNKMAVLQFDHEANAAAIRGFIYEQE